MKKWRVYYRNYKDPVKAPMHSYPMNLSDALDYLDIFNDALFVQRMKWLRIKIKRNSLRHKILMVITPKDGSGI